MSTEHTWRIGEVPYEGFPLLLRYPDDIDYGRVVAEYPRLLVITHTLSHVQKSGLPESAYNKSLEDFDVYLTSYFEERCEGAVALVETFAGKRTYYFYVSADLNIPSRQQEVKGRFPQHDLGWSSRLDTDGQFIKRYAKDFGFITTQSGAGRPC